MFTVLAKLNGSGDLVWTKTLAAERFFEPVFDHCGNLVLAGTFSQRISFGSEQHQSVGERDIFIVVFDSDGNHLWSRTFGSAEHDGVGDIQVDHRNRIVLYGSTGGAIDFGNGPQAGSEEQNIFLLQLDTFGDTLWSRVFDGGSSWYLGIDDENNLYAHGYIRDYLDLGTGRITPPGQDDAWFVTRFDDSGDPQWVRTFGNDLPARLEGFAVDRAGNSVLVGAVEGAVDVGCGMAPPSERLTVIRLDPSGSTTSVTSFPAGMSWIEQHPVIDQDGDIHLSPLVASGVPIDLGSGVVPGDGRAMVFKLAVPEPLPDAPDAGVPDATCASADAGTVDAHVAFACAPCAPMERLISGRCELHHCGNEKPHSSWNLVNGVCVLECDPGWDDCDGDTATGCETDLSSPTDCGQCGNPCPNLCSAQGCVDTCAPPLTNCSGACVDLTSSGSNCGGCGNSACNAQHPEQPVCMSAVCETECKTGYTDCSGECVETSRDIRHCGQCGNDCLLPDGGAARCSNNQCMLYCPPDLRLCGGACVRDRFNCGQCGQACATGECVGGVCDPAWDPFVATATAPIALAADATNIYWLERDHGLVMKAPKTGGSPQVLASGLLAPEALALDASHLYFTDRLGGAVYRVLKSGGTLPEVVAPGAEPRNIALDTAEVYWFNQGNNTFTRAPKTGSTNPVVFYTELGLNPAIVVDNHHIYISGVQQDTYIGKLVKIDKARGVTVEDWCGGFEYCWNQLAQDDTHLFAVGSTSMGGTLVILSIDKQTLQTEASLAGNGGGGLTRRDDFRLVAVGDNAVYWFGYLPNSNQATHLFRGSKCGTFAGTSTVGEIHPDSPTKAFAMDDLHIYFAGNGGIFRMPR